MGTVMEEKIKEAFDEWKKADQQLKEESQMKTTKSSGSLSQQILTYIEAHPGVTGKQLREVVRQRSPKTPVTYVPALLKGLFDSNLVRRTEVPSDGTQTGRPTFSYYALTEEERQSAAKQPAKKVKAKPKAKVKATVEVVDKNGKGITALVPAKRTATHALEVGPMTVAISIAMHNGATYSMNLSDAKYIYAQLNQIFGAAR